MSRPHTPPLMAGIAEPGFAVRLMLGREVAQLSPSQAIDIGKDLVRLGRLATRRFIINEEKWIDE